MPLGVKGRRSYPLLRLGSYKPMAFWPWIVDVWSSFLSIFGSAVSSDRSTCMKQPQFPFKIMVWYDLDFFPQKDIIKMSYF